MFLAKKGAVNQKRLINTALDSIHSLREREIVQQNYHLPLLVFVEDTVKLVQITSCEKPPC